MIAEFILLLLFLMLVVELLTTRLDFMSPTSLMLIGFIIGIAAFAGMQKKWQIDLGIYPAVLMILGIIFFIVGAKIFQAICEIKYVGSTKKLSKPSLMTNNKKLIVSLVTAFILIQFVITLITYKELKNITGFSSISSIISSYRDSLNGSSISLRLSTITTILQKIALAFSLMFIFYAFTLFSDSKQKLYLFIPIIFSSFQQLLMGGRLQIFRFLIMGIFIYYLILRNNNNWSIMEVKKIIRIGIIVFILSIPFFYSLKFLLGRSSTESLLPYVLRYLGGSTGAFAMFINDGVQHSLKFGQETFMGIYDFLGRSNGFNGLVALPWATSPSGDVIGNIYGADRRFMADFGMTGLIAFNFIMGSFYGGFYGVIRKSIIDSKKEFPIVSMLTYSYLLYATFFQFIEGYFYFSIISVNTLVQIVLIFGAVLFTKVVSQIKFK